MDRRTTRASRRRPAGARVIRHPYNKGNGAAVKTGIRQASGTFVLIVDADGQHRPADALRLVTPAERVRAGGRRAIDGDAGHAGRDALGNSLLNCARQLSDRPADSRPHVRLSRGPARLPAGVSAPASERLFDADDDDARVPEGRLQRAVRADRRRRSGRATRKSGSAPTAPDSC